MSLRIEDTFREFETPPAKPSPHQQHTVEPAHSTQVARTEGHYQYHDTPTSRHHDTLTNRPKIDYWTNLLGVETIEKFKDLARDFAEQDSVEDIVNWDKYLLEQLGNEHFVNQYNVWSKEHFAPRPRVNLTVWLGSRTHELRRRLQDANWNVSNPSLKAVSSMMLYGRRLDNDGLFSLGSFQTFWLILRLNMWAISPQNTSPELRQRYGVADAQPRGVLGLRYKLIGDESTKKVLLFFPLGYILYTGALGSDMISDDDAAKWVHEAEWTETPYILAVGVQDDGSTEVRDNNTTEAQFYFIHNPAHNKELRPIPTEDSDDDDDVQDDFFYREPPPFTVARVKERPYRFLYSDISHVLRGKELELEPLSSSTPEIVETTLSERGPKEYVRFGLFPE